MAYDGEIIELPLGDCGLITDDAANKLPINGLILAENISTQNGMIEKEPGSRRWNATGLGSAVRCFRDWWPLDVLQRMIVACANGKIYRFTDSYNSSEVTSTALPTLAMDSQQIHMVEGGIEDPSRSRKLFIFTPRNMPQVITADATVRTTISKPAVDWTNSKNYPFMGLIHRGRLWAFSPDRYYASNIADHEDFQDTTILTGAIYPGEGERLYSAWVYKGKLFVAKYPSGVYILIDDDTDSTNWYFTKLNDNFGSASPHAAIEVLDDMLVANPVGSITSSIAVQAFGDIQSADLLSKLKVEKHLKNELSSDGAADRWAIYDEFRKVAYFAYRGKSSLNNNRMVVIDVSRQQSGPKITLSTKDQPNCFAMVKDIQGVKVPFYGADDGYIYEMNRADRNVNGSGYRSRFQTIHTNLGRDREKLFHFLEVNFEATGRWNLTVEVYIDGVYSETINFLMSKGSTLGPTGTFKLGPTGACRLGPESPKGFIKALHGRGKTISFRCYNSTAGQNFKIQSMKVYFKTTGENQKG
jgi:hypothetical protein